MPANLTPQYHRAEEAYRKAQSADERYACLEMMLREMPKHKGTEKLQADLKSRLKDAREEAALEKKSQKVVGKSWRIPRQGAGTIAVVGVANAGKSRLVRELTGVALEVADYPFTTRDPAPAMMRWENVVVQLIDTPPSADGRVEPNLVSLVRAADAVLLVLDAADDDAPDRTVELIQRFDERKTMMQPTGGFLDDDYSVVRVRTLVVATHGAAAGAGDRLAYWREVAPCPLECREVELEDSEQVERLRGETFRLLGAMRIHTKAPGKKVEMDTPFTLPIGSSVEDLAHKIHEALAAKLKSAKVWKMGSDEARTVGPSQILEEGDIVELATG